MEKNYASFVEYPKQKQGKKRQPFTRDEIQALWDNLHIKNVDIVLILLYTGMRVNELLDMETKNVHLDKRYMFVEKAKTSAGVRNVPLHKKILPLIEARYNKNNTFLFVNDRGGKMKYQNFYLHHFEKNIKPILEINHIIHETRHTFISQCDRLGLNTVTVQRIVGHENKTITQGYTDKTIADIIATIDKFNY
jgi:integrase